MLLYEILLDNYLLDVRLEIEGKQYILKISMFSNSLDVSIQFYNVKEELIFTEILRQGEGIIDMLNILNLKESLLYSLDMERLSIYYGTL